MSVHMVTDEHIHVLVWAAHHAVPGDIGFAVLDPSGRIMTANTKQGRDQLGQMLVDANAASLTARYGDEDPSYTYTHQRPQQTTWDAVELLKAINSYEYQACENPDWSSTAAARFCDALQQRLIRSLPGYDQAPWSL